MRKVIAFGASSSTNSINKSLATYAARQIENINYSILDLNDFEMPIFSVDRERKNGIHELAYKFKDEIIRADGIIISFAEHNGAYSAAFKNIYDWISRLEGDVWESKPMLLLATSPGARGGKTVLELANNRFSRKNRNTIITFSLPEFKKNFSNKGIINDTYKKMFKDKLSEFRLAVLKQNQSDK